MGHICCCSDNTLHLVLMCWIQLAWKMLGYTQHLTCRNALCSCSLCLCRDLKEQGLQGMLPASLGQLSRLQSLSLFGSELAQALPDNWAAADSFPALAALELTHAAEEWELPQSWSREGAFPALRELRLEGIAVAGQLPRNEAGCALM